MKFAEHVKKRKEALAEKKRLREEAEGGKKPVEKKPVEKKPVEEPPLPPPAEPPLEKPPPLEEPEPELKPKWLEEKKKAVAEVEERVRKQKDLDLFQLVLETARLEDLGPEQQAHYRRVEANEKGLCGSCRYQSGCLRCDVEKAWKYVVRWELGFAGPGGTRVKAAHKVKGGGEAHHQYMHACMCRL